ncbi:MAG: type II toxin-antitoxin system RelE/ParE family toxin [Proteobacteria bacterium]|nr:type II toxin-antitoxin system RelE/ParE family toxin [Pseudomonadota bacterium]
MNIRYTERSRDDLELAFVWYERQRRGLGFEFLDCVEATIQNIIDCPEIYQIRYSNFHGSPIRRFPFSIFYTIEEHEIIVHSVFDNRQDPEKKP